MTAAHVDWPRAAPSDRRIEGHDQQLDRTAPATPQAGYVQWPAVALVTVCRELQLDDGGQIWLCRTEQHDLVGAQLGQLELGEAVRVAPGGVDHGIAEGKPACVP